MLHRAIATSVGACHFFEASPVGALVAAGHRGISSGRGVRDWTKRDGAALLAKRRAELFRWLKANRGEAE
jgi:hypothetical protein